ncbi:uncharacterized protein LOC134681339 [Mytilus trossulus]|uniref:uncharacterized protein LOC134681339 n=1 Tax=Mytilus trossulus TaxID=6551 RepID=UPI003006E2A6
MDKYIHVGNTIALFYLQKLLLAAQDGNIEDVELCVKNGANLEYTNGSFWGKTPVMVAAQAGHLEIVRYLAEQDSILETRDKYGWTPLSLAAVRGHLEIVCYLVKEGVNLETKDQRGMTPTMYAAERGHLEIVKFFDTQGSDLQAKSKDGMTPLHFAVERGHLDIVQFLNEKGCDLETRSQRGMTALMYAAERGNIEIVEYLATHGSHLEASDTWWGETPLIIAAEGGYLEIVMSLHTNKSNLEAKTKGGMTPLMFAAEGGHLEIVHYLASHDCDLDTRDLDGETALHYAARSTQAEITQCLIDKGSSPWMKSRKGHTPYDLVIIKDKDSEKEKNKKTEVRDFLKTVMQKTPEEYFQKKKSAMLKRLMGKGTYESFDMRCMVTGQFGVGKSTLVKLLIGDVIPKGRHTTDGISLIEGRCGLDVKTRQWILYDQDTYEASDVVYNKVLMGSVDAVSSKSTDQLDTSKASGTIPSKRKDEELVHQDLLLQQSKAIALPLSSTISDHISNRPTSVLASSTQTSSIVQRLSKKQRKQKIKSKMTEDEIRRKMEKVLKSGEYKMKVGRLIFWDFGGQYVYYTTHQTFMTFRALFLVIFDGSKELHEQVPDVLCFPGQHTTPTPAVFLQHWVNCILTYCKAVHQGIPKILFVATHKDKIQKEKIETQRNNLYKGIEKLFKDHEGRHHLVLDKHIFVNATDKTDSEIDILKKTISDLTFEHPCWGEPMPNACVPLELEIAELVARGKQILSMGELDELNKLSKVSVLFPEELSEFLHFQHSLGKIVYFDTPQLRGFVIISPLLLVEVMRSFVTDITFWPNKGHIRNTFEKMSENGIIKRKDLYHIWKQTHFDKILPYKEFIFDMLTHLDIISEQRRYDIDTGRRLPVENFFVPCMLTQRNETSFMTKECTPEKAINLAFRFKGTIIPPALPNRLISACLSMWTVKTYGGKQLLFSGFIGLSFDKAHDIVVCVEGNKILLYIVHQTSNGLIVPDIATGIKETMFTALERISEFYQSAIHASPYSQKLPFHIEYSCSELECFITEEAALTTDEWICDKHRLLHTKEKWNIWNQKQRKEHCEENCQGLNEGALGQKPTDIELQRFVSPCDVTTVYELAIHLGMTLKEWEELRENYDRIEIVKCRILVNWRDRYKGKFSDIEKALSDMKCNLHMLCRVKRIRIERCHSREEYMDFIPTDEILDELAQVIGVVSFQLGVELGLSITSLDIIQHNNGRDLVAQCKAILFEWRKDLRVRPTIEVLHNALVNVGKGSQCLEEIIKSKGVKKYTLEEEEVEVEKKGKEKTFLKKMNPFKKKKKHQNC